MFFVVDAFTDRPFAGNPAAVVPLERPRDAAWMQSLAAEMNLSETAFIEPHADGRFGLRWFTPKVEVDLCGHATLASAHVLWESGRLAESASAVFDTRSGTLTAARAPDGWIELDFPALTPAPLPLDSAVEKALGHRPVALSKGRMDLLVELSSPKLVREFEPQLSELARLPYRGIVITSVSDDSRFDFVSRFFAPSVGVNEDPVTGSAHCMLTPYWAAKLSRSEMVGRQVSQRGGVVRVRLSGDGRRVALGGQAVTVYHAQLHV